MNCLYSVYDVIDALRNARSLTLKDLARDASLPYTTVASIMSRRPEKMSVMSLDAIAKVFDLQWHDLLGLTDDQLCLVEKKITSTNTGRNINGYRIGTAIDEEAMERIDQHLTFRGYLFIKSAIRDHKQIEIAKRIEVRHPDNLAKATSSDMRRRFDACMDLVFDNLNNAGVIEAMRYILELSKNPEFIRSAELKDENAE